MDAKILVTMEHQDQMKIMSDSLEQFGHCVTEAGSFHAAMDMLRGADFDLIISDVHLQNGGSVFLFFALGQRRSAHARDSVCLLQCRTSRNR